MSTKKAYVHVCDDTSHKNGYDLLGIVVRTAETFYINRTVADGDLNYAERGVSHITATEIAQ